MAGMARRLAAFVARFALSAATLWGAVAIASPGNPANTAVTAGAVSVLLSIAWAVTLVRFLWFLLLPWLVYVAIWLATIMGVYGLGFLQALVVAVALSVLSVLVEWAFGVKTYRAG